MLYMCIVNVLLCLRTCTCRNDNYINCLVYQSHEEGERNNEVNDSSDEDYGDDDSDDPDKLWCLCQQPHDDRLINM